MCDSLLQCYINRLYGDTVMWYKLFEDTYVNRTLSPNYLDLCSEDMVKEREVLWRYSYYLASHCIEERDPVLFRERLTAFDAVKDNYSELTAAINEDLKVSIGSMLHDIEARTQTLFLLLDDLEVLFKRVFTLTAVDSIDDKYNSGTYNVLVTLFKFMDGSVGLKEDEIDNVKAIRGALALCHKELLYKSVEVFAEDIIHFLSLLKVRDNASPTGSKSFYDICHMLVYMYMSDSQDKREKCYARLTERMVNEYLWLDVPFKCVFGERNGILLLKLILKFMRSQGNSNTVGMVYVPESYEAAKLYYLSNNFMEFSNNKDFCYSGYVQDVCSLYNIDDRTTECDLVYQILLHVKLCNEHAGTKALSYEDRRDGLNHLRKLMCSGEIARLLNLEM